jgi:phenylalanyl-tRNA synthetase beta subunit
VVTLDGKKRDLTTDVLVITDGSGVVATAGIMGGESTMVSDGTRRIFLEGASFDAARTRQGARALRLATDASSRFERGVDPDGTSPARASSTRSMRIRRRRRRSSFRCGDASSAAPWERISRTGK